MTPLQIHVQNQKINPHINTDHDLEIPDDSIIDCMNSQAPNDEQLEQALQSYLALTSQTSHSAPNRSINTRIAHHLDQALQSRHKSLADRGYYGGIAGSDVETLSKSRRK